MSSLGGDRYDHMTHEQIVKEERWNTFMHIIKGIIGAGLVIGIMAGVCLFLTWAHDVNKGQYDTYMNTYFGTTHQLMRFKTHSDTSSRWSGGFFLVLGGASGETSNRVSVRFSWRMNNGEYMVSCVPMEKIRVKINNSVRIPTVTFGIRDYDDAPHIRTDREPDQYIIDHCIYKVIVTCTSDQWPLDVSGLKDI